MLDGDKRLAKLLCEFAVRREVNLIMLENLLVNKRLQQIINIVATEMRVAIGRKHLIDVALAGGDQLQNGNVESAAAEIINGDAAALRLMQAISKRGGRRLVDEPKNFEACDPAGVFGGLALRVIKIGRHSDDSAVHRFD